MDNELHLLFDQSWYCDQHPEVAMSGIDPISHYLNIGAALGFDPHPLFDTSFYCEQYPDVLAAGANPLEHFLRHGAAEGRYPHLLFDTYWYRERYPDVAGTNPLIDYLKQPASLGRDPNPWFNTRAYLERYPDVAASRQNPLIHYVLSPAAPTRDRARRRIQVHRARGIGDVLLITPVLAALRKEDPRAEIVVTTDYPELLWHNPHIDAVFKLGKFANDFDETFDLEYEIRPDDHIVDAYARIAGVSVIDRTPQIYLTQDDRKAARDLLRGAGLRDFDRFCVMQLTSGWSVRDWPLTRFKKVAEVLEGDGLRTVVLGHQPKATIDFGFDLRGQTSIRTAAAVIEKCAVMVTIDSSLMHIAYALRRPVVSLFGCTDPEKRVPDWGLPSTLYGNIVCRGCHHRQRPLPATTAPNCHWDTVRCMERLLTGNVVSQARTELAREERPLVSIVVPHYFRYDLLHECLSTVFACGAKIPFEVIVVANGSPDDNLAQLRLWRPRARIVRLEPNQGFSRACNAGVRASRGKYIVILNDDTTVTPGWLDEMIAFHECNPVVGITGPKLLYPQNDLIQHCGTAFNERGMGEHVYRYLPANFAGASKPRYYRALTGACLLMERDYFLLLGGFDTAFHGTGGCEDTDLCFKVLDGGKLVAYCPSSVVYHHEGLTRGLRDENHPEDTHNRKILRERWRKYLTPDITDYCLLAEIEAGEGQSWRWLRDVPTEILTRYDTPEHRTTGRWPFRLQIGGGPPRAGYLRLDVLAGSSFPDIWHELSTPLPFVDESVCEIVTVDLIERVAFRTLPDVLRECYRILSSGGRLVMRVAHLATMEEDSWRSLEHSSGQAHQPQIPGIDREGLAALCRAIGFSEAGVWEAGSSWWGEGVDIIAIR